MKLEKELGNIASVELGLENGEVVAKVKLHAFALLDIAAAKVSAAIPGQIDDAIVNLFVKVAKEELSKS